MEHRFGECRLLCVRHAVVKHGHQPGRDLIVGNLAGSHAAHKEINLVGREFIAIAFLADDVLRSHEVLIEQTGPGRDQMFYRNPLNR